MFPHKQLECSRNKSRKRRICIDSYRKNNGGVGRPIGEIKYLEEYEEKLTVE